MGRSTEEEEERQIQIVRLPPMQACDRWRPAPKEHPKTGHKASGEKTHPLPARYHTTHRKAVYVNEGAKRYPPHAARTTLLQYTFCISIATAPTARTENEKRSDLANEDPRGSIKFNGSNGRGLGGRCVCVLCRRMISRVGLPSSPELGMEHPSHPPKIGIHPLEPPHGTKSF